MEKTSYSSLVFLGQEIGQSLLVRSERVSSAESCTGGLIAAALTETAGSSQWFDQGIVSYGNGVKRALLGVSESTLTNFGAVSEQCAREMVLGALHSSGAHWAVSVTGIAGPSGAVQGKPVGTVCFGLAFDSAYPKADGFSHEFLQTETKYFEGDRSQIRMQAAAHALKQLLRKIRQMA